MQDADVIDVPLVMVGRASTTVGSPHGRIGVTAPRVSPSSRPPVGLRALFGMVGLAAIVFNASLMLSDRAPGLLRRVFGDAVTRLSARIDANARIPAEQLPESDAVVHIAVWAAAALLVGLTIWTWRGLLIGALAVLATSAVVEIAQGVYTSSRAVERSDVIANTIGVALGMLLAAVAYVLWSVGAALGRRSPGR